MVVLGHLVLVPQAVTAAARTARHAAITVSNGATESAWLDGATPVAQVNELCAPLERTATLAVGPAVNDARRDGPGCLEPAPPPLTLF